MKQYYAGRPFLEKVIFRIVPGNTATTGTAMIQAGDLVYDHVTSASGCPDFGERTPAESVKGSSTRYIFIAINISKRVSVN